MTPRSRKDSATRDRLLEAATSIFATRGYARTTVRAICQRAGVNIAAVNYHFGDKETLYEEVLHHAFFRLTGADPTNWGVSPQAPAEERLRAFVRSFLGQLLREDDGAALKLIAREMVDPTPALERLIGDGMRPQVEVLAGVSAELLGVEVDDALARRCTASVLGQCLFYYFAHAVLSRLPMETLTRESLDALADHVTRYSLAALRSMASAEATVP